MPYLVAKTSDGRKGGIWEVRWTWMPYFLAADRKLHLEIDQEMNQLFQSGDGAELMEESMSATVIRLVAQRYPMPGLAEALKALEKVQMHPESRL